MERITLIAGTFEVLGIICIGQMNPIGFILNIIGLVIWIAYSLFTGNAKGLLLVCPIALVANIGSLISWPT